jgi:UDP-2-acetamido-2,6-beta-L-arabino-hexul-4-ose reductase
VNILVTGSEGFIAQNLLARLSQRNDVTVFVMNRLTGDGELKLSLDKADVVFHLAGVNRPPDANEFDISNTSFTEYIIDHLEKRGTSYEFHYSSSTQAALDSPYGISKKAAEDYIRSNVTNGQAYIYRFPGIFGKWSKPNYNSVVATFCYNIARDLPISVSDESNVLSLMYVDDVINELLDHKNRVYTGVRTCEISVSNVHQVTLGEIVSALKFFKASRESFLIPELSDTFIRKLYSTYLTYLPEDKFSYRPVLRSDERGALFELLKTTTAGQIFVSSTFPGITRGNHYHHTKTEKFCVIYGEALIRFRKIGSGKIIEYKVTGRNPEIVDIPPGYTHSIKNIGQDKMMTLFWANEIFNPAQPDTYFEAV